VSLEVAGEDPIVLDLGTGLRAWGETLPGDTPFRGTALLTHIHWDHVQGLPFFGPALRPRSRFDVYGPDHDGQSLGEAVDELIRPPFFPVRCSDLVGDIRFHDLGHEDIALDNGAKVRSRRVPHVGATNGYRVEWDGASVAYISDHQSPCLDGREMPGVHESVLELAEGVDLLIHDAQYWPDEWAEKSHWGHCTVDYAVEVARQAGSRRLVLFHHDPAHGDAEVDRILAHARQLAATTGIDEVIAAHEGLTVSLDR
jgi:phosphoribosyl 1,2-cyclic phosphodiesterase